MLLLPLLSRKRCCGGLRQAGHRAIIQPAAGGASKNMIGHTKAKRIKAAAAAPMRALCSLMLPRTACTLARSRGRSPLASTHPPTCQALEPLCGTGNRSQVLAVRSRQCRSASSLHWLCSGLHIPSAGGVLEAAQKHITSAPPLQQLAQSILS